MLAILLATTLLTACGSGNVEAAHASKAKLDQELTHARTDLGIPDRLLQPVTSGEQKVANGEGGIFYNYDDATKNYDVLYNQLIGIEQTAKQTLQQQAQADMQAFATILNERRGEGFIEIDAYQKRYDDTVQAFTSAQTAADYAHVSDLAEAQTQALQAMWPAYQELQQFQSVIKALSAAGASTQLAQQLYDQDLQVFRDAASADRYQALTSVIDAQIVQVQADQATALPYLSKNQLDLFQARINLLSNYINGFSSEASLKQQYGSMPTADSFQKQYDDDKAQYAAASQTADYAKLATTITSQNAALNSPLIRAKALYDYKQLETLVNSNAVQNTKIADLSGYVPATTTYQLAYAYLGINGVMDTDIGLGPASTPQNYARTDAQFEAGDFRTTSLIANLRAMLDNYNPQYDQVDERNDSTRINPYHEQPHATDLQLMRYYNVMSGKVIIISFGEQVARFYQNGTMVTGGYTYVTTGNPGLETSSIPGFWTALARWAPNNVNPDPGPGVTVPPGYGDMFTSPDPAGSSGYYDPTPIHYDVAYHQFGYWLHDAWWRHNFGPETNLPHHDPAAFNGGSHGCINIPYQTTYGWNMQQVYEWTPIGTPIIIY